MESTIQQAINEGKLRALDRFYILQRWYTSYRLGIRSIENMRWREKAHEVRGTCHV